MLDSDDDSLELIPLSIRTINVLIERVGEGTLPSGALEED